MLQVRGKKGTIYLKRRVPTEYAKVHPSPHVHISLKTDSMAVAAQKADAVWAELVEGWQLKIEAQDADAEKRFEAARRIAKSRGFRYVVMSDLAERAPVSEILERVAAIPEGDHVTAAALLGAEAPPVLNVTAALEKFWGYSRAKTDGMTPDQLRRWKNPKVKAVKNFCDVVGDLKLEQIGPDDMQDFQDWWLDRIAEEDLTPNSANKDFSHLHTILTTVAKKARLGFMPPTKGWRIPQGKPRTRPSFSDEWLIDRLIPALVDPACSLNAEARDVLLVMINTGCRPSEITGLRPQDIRLGGPVPHIVISAEGRKLKTDTSERTLPLVGVSLEAMQRRKDGFPTYAESPSWSATVNKFLKAHGLQQTKRHTAYSLRHSFEDRQLKAGVDERVRRDLMGHSLGRQRYGDGLPLADVQKLLLASAL